MRHVKEPPCGPKGYAGQRMRDIARRAVVLAALTAVLSACTGERATPSPSPSPAPSAAVPARPRFELATFQYAIQVKGKLRVGVAEDSAPFGSKSGSTYVGFDADVAREVARAIFGPAAESDPDRFIEWVPVVSATRISVLTDDKADVVVATFVITDERRQRVDLSRTYFRTGQRIMVKKGDTSIASIDDLAGKTVCALRGSPSERIVVATAKDARLLSLPDSYAACVQALEQGAADAVSADESVLLRFGRPDMRLVGPYLSDEAYAIGTRKERVGFVPFLDGVITAMIDSGRWAALYKTHIAPLSGDLKHDPYGAGRPPG